MSKMKKFSLKHLWFLVVPLLLIAAKEYFLMPDDKSYVVRVIAGFFNAVILGSAVSVLNLIINDNLKR